MRWPHAGGYREAMRQRTAHELPLRWSSQDQPPFVGRQAEVAVLRAAWADTLRGLGQAVFVLGEPGIGKSRLVSEVCVELHDEGAPVYVGSCVPEFGAPYEPFLEPLRRLLAGAPGHPADRGRAGSVQILDVITDSKEGDPAATTGQARLYDAVIDAVKAAAEQGPIVLVLEDLQWADAAAVRLLARLVEATTASSVFIIGTARSTQPDASEDFTNAIARLSRLGTVQRLDLVGFDESEISAYLSRRTGMGVDAAAATARMLWELTGGNPFLLRETWAQSLAAMKGGGSRVLMPETVHDLLRTRIAAMDPPGLSVLQYAAILGQEVDLGELIAVCDTSADQTMEGVDAAVVLGLLEPPRLVTDGYRFPHAIGRQAVIDQIPATRVNRLHAKVAVVLEEQFPTAPRIVQRLAHHYDSARALGFREKAATTLGRAALRAKEGLAFEEAARLYERAADCAVSVVERDDFLLRAARCWTATADFPRAREISESVASNGSPEQRAEAAILYSEACFLTATPGMRAAELLRAARATLPPEGDQALRIRTLAALGRATVHSGSAAEGEALCGKAIAAAREADNVETLADALRFRATATSVPLTPGEVAIAGAMAVEALELVGPDHDAFGPSALYAGINFYIIGDPGGMDNAERKLLEVARRSGPFWHYWITCMQFSRQLAGGRLGDAESAYQRVRRDQGQFPAEIAPGAEAVQSYMLRREAGTLDRIAHLVTGDEQFGTRWMPGLLALYTELEMVEPARRALAWLLDRACNGDWDSSDRRAQLVFLAEAAVWLEDRDAASLIRPWLADYAGMNLMIGQFVAVLGSTDRYLAELDSLCSVGDPLESLRTAIQMDRRMGAHLHVAYSWVAMAAHLQRSGASDGEIREAIDSARSIAEPAGLERVLRMLRALDRSSRAYAQGGLTSREVEVIRLIADGLSNRDIATRLVISEHTAANHVRSILFKINAENRTQAAIYARDRGIA
jgi:DNA-binding CsgD family transcriptional regulator